MTKKPNENDVVFIQALAELLSSQDLTEIEVNRLYGEDNSLNVRISKTQNVVAYGCRARSSPCPAAPAAPPSPLPKRQPRSKIPPPIQAR